MPLPPNSASQAQMDPKIFETSAKTWKTYAVAICILGLTLLIDALSEFSFLQKQKPIDLAGFKVVREALSATYGFLFAVFVARVSLESRLLNTRLSATAPLNPEARTVLDLWLLSPFSESRWLRRMFWFLFIVGFLYLAVFSVIHLAYLFPPDRSRMSRALYVGIGGFDFIVLLFCLRLGNRTYRNLQDVRSKLHQMMKSPT